MTVNELTKELRRAGCYLLRHGAKHDIWYSPLTGKQTQVSRHGTEELKQKTLRSILTRLLGRKPG
ncbi:MAG: type II toxin-antitoxin system HicA family toxin [Bacteroidaceae bacterium]|nr:type II toxin-antitoxin system HicA family toxin [Bacteroidaceae bacterium]